MDKKDNIPNNEVDRPIFITGSVRSGTSIVNLALTKGAKIRGYKEGCFIQFLGAFQRAVDFDYKRRKMQLVLSKNIMLSRVGKDDLLHSFYDWYKNEYYKYNKYKGQWVDKTADIYVVNGVPGIFHIWPNAKVIFMKRRPIENMISRKKKFPNVIFENHCIQWQRLMDAWYEVKENIPKESFMEIDQYEVATNPEEVAQKIGDFLSLSEKQIKNITKVFLNDRPEDTGGDENSVHSLDEMSWSKEEKETFKKICGPVAEKYGWSLENRYYK